MRAHKIAVAGVLVTAVLAAVLVMPAARQLGTAEGMWAAAAILGIPGVVVLAVSGYRHYGAPRSLAVGVGVMVVTCVVALVVAVLTLATALSGSTQGLLLSIALFGAPALTVVVLGLLALRVVPGRSAVGRERIDGAREHSQ